MRYLLDTHLLLWFVSSPDLLGIRLTDLLDDSATVPCFSAVSVWEVAIKAGLQRSDFAIDPSRLREALLAEEFVELVVDGADAAGVLALPPLHRDPFDRLLLAQARRRGILLLTRDAQLAAYGTGVEMI